MFLCFWYQNEFKRAFFVFMKLVNEDGENHFFQFLSIELKFKQNEEIK